MPKSLAISSPTSQRFQIVAISVAISTYLSTDLEAIRLRDWRALCDFFIARLRSVAIAILRFGYLSPKQKIGQGSLSNFCWVPDSCLAFRGSRQKFVRYFEKVVQARLLLANNNWAWKDSFYPALLWKCWVVGLCISIVDHGLTGQGQVSGKLEGASQLELHVTALLPVKSFWPKDAGRVWIWGGNRLWIIVICMTMVFCRFQKESPNVCKSCFRKKNARKTCFCTPCVGALAEIGGNPTCCADCLGFVVR